MWDFVYTVQEELGYKRCSF